MRYLTPMLALALLMGLQSCTQAEPAGEQPDYAAMITMANEELLNNGNLDYADEVFASEYRDGAGPDWIKQMVGAMRTAFPDLHVEVDLFVVDGNMISWRRTHTGTFQGALFGVAPTGAEMAWTSLITSRYEDNKVVEEWGQDDLDVQLCQAAMQAMQTSTESTEPEEMEDSAEGSE